MLEVQVAPQVGKSSHSPLCFLLDHRERCEGPYRLDDGLLITSDWAGEDLMAQNMRILKSSVQRWVE